MATTAQFAADYADELEAQGVVLADKPGFVATFAGQLTDWLGGGDAIPAELAYRLKQTLGFWNAFTSGMVGFLTIDAEGGPNGDGTVTIVDGLGVTHTIDSLARLVLEMAGIVIKGTLPTVGDLPAAGQKVGDIYLVDGVGYTWTGAAWDNIGPIRGPKGDAATVAVGTVDTVAPGAPAAVVNSGTAAAAVFDFEIPQGDPGVAATVAVGEVTTGAAGSAASVINAGTPGAAVFDFAIPQGDKGVKGDAATIAVGVVATVAPGSPATVVNSGTAGAAVFDFELPHGATGLAATVAVGEVSTGAPGAMASVVNSGTAGAAIFDFEIPQGLKGDKGEAFAVNATGLLANRALYDAELPGFSFLATDAGEIYFRLDPAGWSDGVLFGRGEVGASAYEVALANGFVGTEAEWLASLHGADGADGADGANGADGSDASVTKANVEAALGGPVVLTVNGVGPDSAGDVVVDAGGALESDMIRVFLALTELRAGQFGTPNGIADDFADQTGVDAATSAGQTYDATAQLFKGGGGESYEPVSPLPAMTANDQPAPHEVMASTENGPIQAAWKAFDGLVASAFWSTSAAGSGFPQWLCRKTPAAIMAGAYRITSSSAGWAPKNWTFEGANSLAGPWTVLDTQTNQVFVNNVARTFLTTNTTLEFTHHRIVVTATTNGVNVNVAEFELLARTYLEGTIDLRSIAYAALSAPSKASLLTIARAGVPIAAGANFHGYVSRDNGATWTEATLSARETIAGFTVFDAFNIDLTAQPAGTSMRWRVSGTDYGVFEITAAALMWN